MKNEINKIVKETLDSYAKELINKLKDLYQDNFLVQKEI
jgi:hypothetical protein